jgi:hypothetical protein
MKSFFKVLFYSAATIVGTVYVVGLLSQKQRDAVRQQEDEQLDEALEMTFPASDPPATY